jgi:hypothetical protein
MGFNVYHPNVLTNTFLDDELKLYKTANSDFRKLLYDTVQYHNKFAQDFDFIMVYVDRSDKENYEYSKLFKMIETYIRMCTLLINATDNLQQQNFALNNFVPNLLQSSNQILSLIVDGKNLIKIFSDHCNMMTKQREIIVQQQVIHGLYNFAPVLYFNVNTKIKQLNFNFATLIYDIGLEYFKDVHIDDEAIQYIHNNKSFIEYLSVKEKEDDRTFILNKTNINQICVDFKNACFKQDIEIIKIFLMHYVIEPNACDNICIKNACYYNQKNIVKLLLENRNFRLNNDDIMRFILNSCNNNYHIICKLLLDHYKHLYVEEKKAKLCLIKACNSGHFEIIKVLDGDNRFQKYISNYLFEECTTSRVKKGQDKIIEYLFKIGKKPNADNKSLFKACKLGRTNIVKIFLKDGSIDPNMHDCMGILINKKRTSIFHAMIKDDRIKIDQRLLPFAASSNKSKELVKILLDKPCVSFNVFYAKEENKFGYVNDNIYLNFSKNFIKNENIIKDWYNEDVKQMLKKYVRTKMCCISEFTSMILKDFILPHDVINLILWLTFKQ